MRTPSARTIVLAVLACALPLGVLPASGEAAEPTPGAQAQTLKGTIAVPSRFPDTTNGNADRGWPGLARRLWVAASTSSGVIASVFDVNQASWGGPFVIDGVTDATGAADLDVYFYDEMGDVAGQTAGVTKAEYATVAAGGETGFVPQGARKAIVYTANGVQSEFTYTAFRTPTLTLGAQPLDVTVPAGTTLTFVNGTGDYTFVRHLPSKPREKVAFDSGSGPASGLAAGERFSATFPTTGTLVYETSLGQGTVTVVDGPGVGTPSG